MLNTLTIDLEDWYQGLTSTSTQIGRWSQLEDRVVANTEKLLDIFAEYDVKATFFVLGYVADQFPAIVRRVADEGHEIGLHGYHHYRVSTITPEQFRRELVRGRKVVEDVTGQAIRGHRAPMFSINRSCLWAFDILREQGFLYDSSVFPIRNPYYGIVDAPREPFRPIIADNFIEFPMSALAIRTFNLPISGGFYMRLMPNVLFQRAIHQLHQQKRGLNFYLHPWELDPTHPRLPLTLKTMRERFTHYWGLNSVEHKLCALLKSFEFTTLGAEYDRLANAQLPLYTKSL